MIELNFSTHMGGHDEMQLACLVGSAPGIKEGLLAAWPETRAQWKFFANAAEALNPLLLNPPNILFCVYDFADAAITELVKLFKQEYTYSPIPVVLCIPESVDLTTCRINEIDVDDFLIFPCSPVSLCMRLDMLLVRGTRSLDASPLTHLPGNASIMRRIQKMLDAGENFALGYCDLDHFKSYNDRYGFARGDEVLVMTARVITNTINATEISFSFVGHIGGDDFIFLLPFGATDWVCSNIIKHFDRVIPQFYDEEDVKRGYIVSTDRNEVQHKFPFMTMSIAIVHNNEGCFKNYVEISQRAIDLKKEAKKRVYSCYVFDRRK